MQYGIKVGQVVKRHHYIAGDYTWILMRENGEYVLTRNHARKNESGISRFSTLKAARLEFMRQQFCLDSEYFAGFSRVI